jgi:hypothetical protein
MVDYLQPPLGYLLRIPSGDHAADSPLDEPARARAEEAAAFLRYERIGRIYAEPRAAAVEAGQIAWLSCSRDFGDCVYAGDPESFVAWLKDSDRGLPAVLVATETWIEAALKIMLGASVCAGEIVQPQQANPGLAGVPEIVAPGGIISIHRDGEGVALRARHMILDFAFTDFVKAAEWGHAGRLLVEKP